MNALQFVKTPNVRIKRSRKKKNGDRSEDVPHVAITKADHSKVRKWVSYTIDSIVTHVFSYVSMVILLCWRVGSGILCFVFYLV